MKLFPYEFLNDLKNQYITNSLNSLHSCRSDSNYNKTLIIKRNGSKIFQRLYQEGSYKNIFKSPLITNNCLTFYNKKKRTNTNKYSIDLKLKEKKKNNFIRAFSDEIIQKLTKQKKLSPKEKKEEDIYLNSTKENALKR